VTVNAVTPFTVESTDGVAIEAAVQTPPQTKGYIVVCHPHPAHGGSMRHPLVRAIANRAASQGFSGVRFNFRGVGASNGVHTGGQGEIDDLAAIMNHVGSATPPVVGIAGWSFGAAVALIWQAKTDSTIPYVGIAPPIRETGDLALPKSSALADAQRGFIIGERDQFVDADTLANYAESIDARVHRYANTDHFFINKYERLAEDVVRTITDSVAH
jgi:alpha/beta superfamily hydrolase